MRLFAKLLVIVVALGATALGLLALRQQRYEVSNEISRTHNRIVEQERAQWRMRAQVAARSTPADIRKAAERQGIDLAPVQESVTEAEAAVGAKAESAAVPAVPATKAKAVAPAKPAAKGASRGR
jgi:cell division protein FtsL